MDILIKNMDLSEDRQIIITKKGEVLATDWRGISMPTNAMAIELPPHGRLIDADAFIEKNKEGFETPWEEHGARIGTIKVPLRPVEEAINNAPTILEASR